MKQHKLQSVGDIPVGQNSKATISLAKTFTPSMSNMVQEMSTAAEKLARDARTVTAKMAQGPAGMDEYKQMCLDAARLNLH